MAVVRCSKGHYYDDTKFAQCPHCGVLPDAKEGKPAKQKRFGFFHKDDSGKKSKQAGAQNMEELNEGLTEAASEDLYNPDRTIGLSEMIGGEGNRTEAFPHMAAGADNNQTVSFPHMGAGGDDGRTIAYPHPSRQPVNEDDNRTIAYPHPSRQPVNEDENRTIAYPHPSGQPVNEDENRTIAYPHPSGQPVNEDENRTIAYPHPSRQPINEDENRTIAYPHPSRPEENTERVIPAAKPAPAPQPAAKPAPETAKPAPAPEAAKPVSAPQPAAKPVPVSQPVPAGSLVAGWLVCVKGQAKGQDYRLFKGFNRIGNSQKADIVLPQGDSGEEKLECAVVYDDRSNCFYAVKQAGEPVLRNGEKLQGAAEIHTGDVLLVGESEFEFVAFCREGRRWDTNE